MKYLDLPLSTLPFVPTANRAMFILTLLLGILIAFMFQGSRGLYESTEGRYAQCAKETLESGNLLEPVLNGEHHWSKPPLAYLPIAAGIQLFGNNAWGARVAQALIFVFTVVAVYAAGRELWSPGAGALAALVYATSPFVAGAANTVSADNLLVLFEALAVAAFWRAVRRNRFGLIVAMWAFLGLAFFTKGPVGLFPLLGILPAQFLLHRQGTPVPRVATAAGLGVFLVIGLGWYAAEVLRYPGLLDRWLVHETLDRFATDEYRRNAEFYKAFTIYLPILLLGTGPWGVILLWNRKALGISRNLLRRWRVWEYPIEWTYLITATLIPLTLLMVSHSRLPLYALPLFLPLALAMGEGLHRLLNRHRLSSRGLMTTAGVLALVVISLKAGSAYYPSRRDMGQLANALRPVLKEYPGAPLELLYDEPLNGLEFYLDRQISVHALPELSPKTSQKLDQDAAIQPGTLVIARTKHLKRFSGFLPTSTMDTLYQDENWALVKLNRVLDLAKQAELLRERSNSAAGFETPVPVHAKTGARPVSLAGAAN